jgi:hypothetical protein
MAIAGRVHPHASRTAFSSGNGIIVNPISIKNYSKVSPRCGGERIKTSMLRADRGVLDSRAIQNLISTRKSPKNDFKLENEPNLIFFLAFICRCRFGSRSVAPLTPLPGLLTP